MQEGRDHWLHDFDVSDDPATCPPEPMDAEDLLFLMYTSGTTAKPKGIAHTTGGYLVGVASTHALIFDLKPEDDVYWCAADIGWITGHSYIVYGPLTNGATSVLYEGTPDFPGKDRWWDGRADRRRACARKPRALLRRFSTSQALRGQPSALSKCTSA